MSNSKDLNDESYTFSYTKELWLMLKKIFRRNPNYIHHTKSGVLYTKPEELGDSDEFSKQMDELESSGIYDRIDELEEKKQRNKERRVRESA